MRAKLTLTVLTLFTIVCGTAQAAFLYGVADYDPFGTQGLYEINPMTGESTFIGDTGLTQINGIEFNSLTGLLYAYTNNADLYTLDLNTGASTLVATQANIAPEGDLAFDAAGMLYTTNGGTVGTLGLNDAFYKMLGHMGAAADDVSGLAIDATGALLGYSKNGGAEDSLININLTNGVATTIGLTGLDSNENIGGMDIDPDTGVVYLTDAFTLFTVDTTTGVATTIGNHTHDYMSGIAFVPEPASALLVLVGGIALIRRH